MEPNDEKITTGQRNDNFKKEWYSKKRVVRSAMEKLEWSEVKSVQTKFGERFRRTCWISEDDSVWYKSQKPRLEGLGITIHKSPGASGSHWHYLAWWSDPNDRSASHKTTLSKSRETDAEISIPVPDGLELRGFQKACVSFMLGRPATLIGDDMGVGKTIELIAYVNAMNKSKRALNRILIVVPPVVRINWTLELKKWIYDKTHTIGIAFKDWPNTEIVVIGYSMASKFLDQVINTSWDLVVLDEAHYVSNRKAKTTRIIFGYIPKIKECLSLSMPGVTTKYRVAMTGTPIPNKVENCYSIIRWLDPVRWNDWGKFYFNYSGNGGYLSDGHIRANMLRLQDTLRKTIMIRREKADVVSELPPINRRMHVIPQDEVAGWRSCQMEMLKIMKSDWSNKAMDRKARLEIAKCIGTVDEIYAASEALKKSMGELEMVSGDAMQNVGITKVPIIAKMVNEEYADKRILVVAHHREVLERLHKEIPGSSLIYGSTPNSDRQRLIDSYQNTNANRVLIMQIVMAIGVTLTKADMVIFAEGSWLPSVISQAESRPHRIGRTEPVDVVWPVVSGGIDMLQAQRVIAKQQTIDLVLNLNTKDGDIEREPVIPQPGITLLASKVSDQSQNFRSPEAIEAAVSFVKKMAASKSNEVNSRICRMIVEIPMCSRLAVLVNEIRKQDDQDSQP